MPCLVPLFPLPPGEGFSGGEGPLNLVVTRRDNIATCTGRVAVVYGLSFELRHVEVLMQQYPLLRVVIAAFRTPPISPTKSASWTAEKVLHGWHPPCAALIATEETPLGIFKRHTNFL